ncbi:hypothetical protein [Variovorax ginsengisoli]|uniref:Oxidoreductase molybdopterin-binding domain-containing protein n=1 Tax=Variovorax ginsengisoli TaxID=363844 RepID=A0ABT9SEC6_9BURK|nr:hypothetical protein [Variovorax ginsengisoli]MDP9902725.1 hypothetical protein [Variovorax ginsengisoli]
MQLMSTSTIAQASPPAPGLPSPRVSIGGWVRQPARLDAGQLERLGAIDVPNFVVRCTVDGAHGGPRPMRAVALRRLIEQSQPAFAQRTDFKRVAIVAESQDGYRALFSWSELFHTVIGTGVHLAFDCAQAPLAGDTGPFALVSLHDEFTGPRFVRQLASVELHKLW